ncbi:MAG TPA: biotin/lipoyl-containing protein, partial [Jatrophihabitans sp.]|nr:biotin/lipoyl-containing protein [Jatrophihabitans sp.]
MAIEQFKLPDLGEGLTEGDILKWTVAVGDHVEVNDTIAEVETVKAAVELPSPYAGVVTALHAAEGETVPVGTAIISIETGGAAGPDAAENVPSRAEEDLVPGLPGETGVAVPGIPGEGALPGEEKQMTLVGYGPREETGRRRRRRPEGAVAGAQASFNLPPDSGAHSAPAPHAEEPAEPARGRTVHRVLAKPPVRKLAKNLGVDL